MGNNRLVLLGSTGSIGKQSLEVVRQHHDAFSIAGLGTRRNVDTLQKQVQDFQPAFVAVADLDAAAEFDRSVLPPGATFLTGPDALSEMARECPADVAVVATVGAAGFRPTFAAVQAGKNIALANKEVLAMAGGLLMKEAKQYNTPIVPIDSEHSAILQCIQCGQLSEIDRIVLTASGGPFRGQQPEQFENVSVQEALQHPTWSMGAKITIDSATLFNKGLEVIEAHHLFQQPLEQIDVIVHPQSIIHSMVEFTDGSVMAQLGDADMRTPIQYALSYPRRIERSGRKLNLLEIAELTFFPPDLDSFPCLRLAYEAARIGGTMPAYLSVANEEVVEAFLQERISFGAIPRLLEDSMMRHQPTIDYCLDDIYATDEEARRITRERIAALPVGS